MRIWHNYSCIKKKSQFLYNVVFLKCASLLKLNEIKNNKQHATCNFVFNGTLFKRL